MVRRSRLGFRRAVVPVALIAATAVASGWAGDPSAAGPPGSESPPAPTATTPAPQHSGIDVSWHSGDVDWRAVRAAGHTFAYLKATEGVDLADPAFPAHWQAAKEAGIVRGAYHFYVTEDDPEEQARFFISNVELEPGDLVPVVDVEVIGHGTEPGLAGRLRRFCDLIEAHYGVRPVIYTSPTFWNRHFDASFGAHPLWIAEYGVDQPTVPEGWRRWHLWQWRENAAIPGVEKGADVSHVNIEAGSLDALRVPSASLD